MCTATWIRTEEGYEVFFNRDELRTRRPALPPRANERAGVAFLAPVDGDAGGTWLGVNELGVTVGIANGGRSERDERAAPFRSRGLLVMDLLASASVGDAEARIGALETALYRAFELFAVDPGGTVRVWRFDGERLEVRTAGGEGAFLISSSRDLARAKAERERVFARMLRERGRLDAELLAAFHASHEPERGAFSPCMHREDASTVSLSRVSVTASAVAFAYRPGPPCEEAETVVHRMPRRSRV